MDVLLDTSYGNEPEDLLARRRVQLHGQRFLGNDKFAYRGLTSFKTLIETIASFKQINTLLIWLHGIPSAFLFDEGDRSLSAIAAELKKLKKRPVVAERIHIASCSVVEQWEGMFALAECLNAPRIDGYTWHHHIGHLDAPVALLKMKNADTELRAKLSAYRDYLVPPEPTASELLAQHGKTALVLIEWWRRELVFDATELPSAKNKPLLRPESSAKLIRATEPSSLKGSVSDKEFQHIDIELRR